MNIRYLTQQVRDMVLNAAHAGPMGVHETARERLLPEEKPDLPERAMAESDDQTVALACYVRLSGRDNLLTTLREESQQAFKIMRFRAAQYMTRFLDGAFLTAEFSLEDALAYDTRGFELQALTKEVRETKYERDADRLLLGLSMDERIAQRRATFVKARAERTFREFDAAFRKYIEAESRHGERFGPAHLEKLYSLSPVEREKVLDGFSPTKEMITEGEPCDHALDDKVYKLTDDFGRKQICTECHRKYDVMQLNGLRERREAAQAKADGKLSEEFYDNLAKISTSPAMEKLREACEEPMKAAYLNLQQRDTHVPPKYGVIKRGGRLSDNAHVREAQKKDIVVTAGVERIDDGTRPTFRLTGTLRSGVVHIPGHGSYVLQTGERLIVDAGKILIERT